MTDDLKSKCENLERQNAEIFSKLEKLTDELQSIKANKSGDDKGSDTKSFSLRHRIRQSLARYQDGFTMNGLYHLNNTTGVELLFWIVLVVGAIALGGYLLRGLFDEFLNYEVTSRMIIKRYPDGMQLPSIMICDNAIQKDFTSKTYTKCSSWQQTECVNASEASRATAKKRRRRNSPGSPGGGVGGGNVNVTNDGSNLGNVDSADADSVVKETKCHNTPLKLSLMEGSDKPGDVKDLGSVVKGIGSYCKLISLGFQSTLEKGIEIQVNEQDQNKGCMDLAFYLNQPNESFHQSQARGPSFVIKGRNTGKRIVRGQYEVKIKKFVNERVPKPFSNCLKGMGDDTQNIFIGDYTYNKCQMSCEARWKNKFCGSVEEHITPNIRLSVLAEMKLLAKKVFDCTGKTGKTIHTWGSGNWSDCTRLCQEPCKEVLYKSETTLLNEMTSTWVHIKFEELAERLYIESPAQNLESFIGNIGGMIGLMCGVSLLSVIEMLIWFLLGCCYLLVKLRGASSSGNSVTDIHTTVTSTG